MFQSLRNIEEASGTWYPFHHLMDTTGMFIGVWKEFCFFFVTDHSLHITRCH